jgi:hypothetical protein
MRSGVKTPVGLSFRRKIIKNWFENPRVARLMPRSRGVNAFRLYEALRRVGEAVGVDIAVSPRIPKHRIDLAAACLYVAARYISDNS